MDTFYFKQEKTDENIIRSKMSLEGKIHTHIHTHTRKKCL